MWFVYIIECKDGSLYTGSTNNLEERFKKHKEGKGAKYTRSHIPRKIVFSKKYRSKITAFKKEREIKNLVRSEKLEFIKSHSQPG
jgi:putative endonuclease